MNSLKVVIVFVAVLVMAAVGGIVPNDGLAATYTLAPTADAFVYHNDPSPGDADNNYGSTTALSVFRRDSYNQTQRSFLKFDLSDISAGETIIGATLHLYAYGFHTFGPLDTTLHYVGTDSWTEGALTWNNQPAFGNQLDLKTTASWNYVYPTPNPQWGVWDLFAVPGAWDPAADLSASDGYLSLLLKVSPESGNKSGELFYSKEYTGDIGLRPYLLVETQAAPIPPSLVLFGSGLASSILFARRRKSGK